VMIKNFNLSEERLAQAVFLMDSIGKGISVDREGALLVGMYLSQILSFVDGDEVDKKVAKVVAQAITHLYNEHNLICFPGLGVWRKEENNDTM